MVPATRRGQCCCPRVKSDRVSDLLVRINFIASLGTPPDSARFAGTVHGGPVARGGRCAVRAGASSLHDRFDTSGGERNAKSGGQTCKFSTTLKDLRSSG